MSEPSGASTVRVRRMRRRIAQQWSETTKALQLARASVRRVVTDTSVDAAVMGYYAGMPLDALRSAGLPADPGTFDEIGVYKRPGPDNPPDPELQAGCAQYQPPAKAHVYRGVYFDSVTGHREDLSVLAQDIAMGPWIRRLLRRWYQVTGLRDHVRAAVNTVRVVTGPFDNHGEGSPVVKRTKEVDDLNNTRRFGFGGCYTVNRDGTLEVVPAPFHRPVPKIQWDGLLCDDMIRILAKGSKPQWALRERLGFDQELFQAALRWECSAPKPMVKTNGSDVWLTMHGTNWVREHDERLEPAA